MGAEQNKQTLIERLLDASKQFGGIPKNGYNAYSEYYYVTAEDMFSVVRKELLSRDILFTARIDAWQQMDVKSVVNYTFSFMDVSTGEKLEFPWVGEGKDQQDKGIAKAGTSAIKYFLRSFFLIPSEDADSDRESTNTTEAGSQSKLGTEKVSRKSTYKPTDDEEFATQQDVQTYEALRRRIKERYNWEGVEVPADKPIKKGELREKYANLQRMEKGLIESLETKERMANGGINE